MGFEIDGAPAGEGRLDIPDLLARLRRLRWQADAILEQWVPPAATLDDTLARELQWAETSLRNLAPLFPRSNNPPQRTETTVPLGCFTTAMLSSHTSS
jgi:hypothetical protein